MPKKEDNTRKNNLIDKFYNLFQSLTSKPKSAEEIPVTNESISYTAQYNLETKKSMQISENEAKLIIEILQKHADKAMSQRQSSSTARKTALQAQLGGLNYLSWKLTTQHNENPISDGFIQDLLKKRNSLIERVGDKKFETEFLRSLPNLKGAHNDLKPQMINELLEDVREWRLNDAPDGWEKLDRSSKKRAYD